VLVSREILAKSIGVAYETIIRTVSQFKSEGWVASRGRKLVLTDRNQLLVLLE
jgi:CRP-like cAMP-binding protein